MVLGTCSAGDVAPGKILVNEGTKEAATRQVESDEEQTSWRM